MKPLLLSVLLISVFVLGACQKKESSTVESHKKSTDKVLSLREIEVSSATFLDKPYLRGILPDSSYAYIRIPNSWAIMGIPTGNVFNKPLASKPYVGALTSIRDGFSENVMPELSGETRVFLGLFLLHARSVIEATVLKTVVEDKEAPTPNVLITVAVDYKNTDDLNSLLDTLVSKNPEITFDKRLQKGAIGELTIQGFKLQIKLDTVLSRVFVLGGMKLTESSMENALKPLKANPDHAMAKFESDIDDSGQGLFAWADPRELFVLAKAMGKGRELAPLAMLGATSIKNIAAGLGSSGGINRLKFVLDMPKAGFRAMIPSIVDMPTFSVAGDTSAVVTLGFPTKSDFILLESSFAGSSSSSKMDTYYEFKKTFSKATGVELEDMFDLLGQDISFVIDEAGFYYAVRLKDAEKFKHLLERLIKEFDLKYEEREIAGQKYHHLRIPAFKNKLLTGKENALMKRFISVPGNVFWQQEGDYLLVASLPQILMDRHYVSKQAVNDWYKNKQKMDPDGALLMASMRTKDVPAFMYKMKLVILSYLGEVVERPVDLFSLPSVKEAGLPENGAYGVKLSSSEEQFAFELTFESNPYELAFSFLNSYAAIALTGIAAAVAVPAYDDYIKKAKTKKSSEIGLDSETQNSEEGTLK